MPEAGEARVEIHRDLSHRVDLLPAHDVIASAKQVAAGLLLPACRHRIVHNVVHAQIENGDWIGGVLNLRDNLDLARLISSCGPEFEWTSLAEEAKERGFFNQLSGAIHCAHRVLRSPMPTALASHLPGRLHAWRCVQQRRWPKVGKPLEFLGVVARGLAWERDAYPLNLKTRSLKARILVNRRRLSRIIAALHVHRAQPSQLPTPHAEDGGKPSDRIAEETIFSANSTSAVELRVLANWSKSDEQRAARRSKEFHSRTIDFAITTVARPTSYIHDLIASLPSDLPLRLIVGAPDYGYLRI